MNRSVVPIVICTALLAFAGCTTLGPAAPTSSPDAPTDSPATLTAYPATTTELPDGPAELPERPAKLNATSASSYVRTVEYRYAYNALWYDDSSDVSLECETESVERARDGYRVTVGCHGYSNTGDDSAGTATATAVHADWGERSFTYYVDEDTTLRFDDDGTPSPA